MKTKIRIEKLISDVQSQKPDRYYVVLDITEKGYKRVSSQWIGPTARTHNQAIMRACCALDRLIQRLERKWKE